MTRLALLVAAAALTLALAGSALAAPGGAAPTRLDGAVGPGFTITLKKAGKKVTRLAPGRYSLVVNDKANIHNFHLRGPGVNKASGVGATGTKTWTVNLRAGSYTFVCDPHASNMKGSFTVA